MLLLAAFGRKVDLRCRNIRVCICTYACMYMYVCKRVQSKVALHVHYSSSSLCVANGCAANCQQDFIVRHAIHICCTAKVVLLHFTSAIFIWLWHWFLAIFLRFFWSFHAIYFVISLSFYFIFIKILFILILTIS